MIRQFRSPVLSAVVVSAAAVLCDPVSAAEGRYQMTPIDGGFMRLDTETGAVSVCKTQTDKAVCELAEDGSARYSKEIDSLKQENEKLQSQVDRLEQHFGLGPEPTQPGNDLEPPVPPSPGLKVPQKEDVDKMFDYIEGMLNKFRERLKRLEKEPNPETPL